MRNSRCILIPRLRLLTADCVALFTCSVSIFGSIAFNCAVSVTGLLLHDSIEAEFIEICEQFRTKSVAGLLGEISLEISTPFEHIFVVPVAQRVSKI